MKKAILFMLLFGNGNNYCQAQLLSETAGPSAYSITGATILVDSNDYMLIRKAALFLASDMQSVTLKQAPLSNITYNSKRTAIIIGSADKSSLIKQLVQQKKISVSDFKSQWEAYSIQTVKNPFKGIDQALVIVGSDRRGAAFGVFELSKQMGVSPWYWWADVQIQKSAMHLK
jgi:hypothetical protein